MVCAPERQPALKARRLCSRAAQSVSSSGALLTCDCSPLCDVSSMLPGLNCASILICCEPNSCTYEVSTARGIAAGVDASSYSTKSVWNCCVPAGARTEARGRAGACGEEGAVEDRGAPRGRRQNAPACALPRPAPAARTISERSSPRWTSTCIASVDVYRPPACETVVCSEPTGASAMRTVYQRSSSGQASSRAPHTQSSSAARATRGLLIA